jgi:hypothetical protein
MALHARVGQIIVRNVGFLRNPALRDVPNGPGFLGRQPMVRAEIFDDETRLWRSERDVIHKNHSFQRILPAFGRSPCPRDTLHISLLVARVAVSALGDHQWIVDRNAFFAYGPGRLGRGGFLLALLGRTQRLAGLARDDTGQQSREGKTTCQATQRTKAPYELGCNTSTH